MFLGTSAWERFGRADKRVTRRGVTKALLFFYKLGGVVVLGELVQTDAFAESLHFLRGVPAEAMATLEESPWNCHGIAMSLPWQSHGLAMAMP